MVFSLGQIPLNAEAVNIRYVNVNVSFKTRFGNHDNINFVLTDLLLQLVDIASDSNITFSIDYVCLESICFQKFCHRL